MRNQDGGVNSLFARPTLKNNIERYVFRVQPAYKYCRNAEIIQCKQSEMCDLLL